jgi:flavin reductase (DIM6/NTAB) family NADH-FMN oxidoreductase RutF
MNPDAALLQRLQLLARLETHSLAWRNRDLGPRARVAADPGFSWFYVKHAKASQFDAIALLQSLLHGLEDGLHGHLCFGFGDAGFVDHFVNNIQLDQGISSGLGAIRPRRRQPYDRIGFILMSSEGVASRMAGVSSDEFRRACGRFATGIAVAAVMDDLGVPHGLTVSSFTSVSLEPPLILICLGHAVTNIEEFRRSRHLGLSFLCEEQRYLSDRFAQKGHDRFDGVAWYVGETGAPLLADSLAAIECAAYQRFTSGDHDIIVGEVIRTDVREGSPLIYFASRYRRLLTE